MGRKGRGLHPEEAALWRRIADSARPMPLRQRRKKVTPAPPQPEGEAGVPERAQPAQPVIAPFRIGEAAPGGRPHLAVPPAAAERPSGASLRIDSRTFTRLSRGKLRPEAKLDLHGMTLASAHPALTRFIVSAHAAGRRLVLVVTGKGRDRDEGGPIPAPKGALRHQVPAWLAQPPLASVVLQVVEAHRRHGGAGAFYVYLRRHPGRRLLVER